VYDFVWVDDFAAARNYSYSLASCDFIMWLDADDVIEVEDAEKIRALKTRALDEADVVFLRRELCTAEHYEEALAVYAGMKDEAPWQDISYALFFVIISLKQLKRWEELLEELLNLSRRFVPNEMICAELGNCYMREHHDEEAEQWYNRALDYHVDLKDLELHFEAYHEFIPCQKLCKLYMKKGDTLKARQYYERAAAVYPHNPVVELNKLYFETLGGKAPC
jgi:tetratricopeptide (TPR) repeat protein